MEVDGCVILSGTVLFVWESMFQNVWKIGRAILLGVVFLVKEGVFWNIWEDR